MTLQENEKRQFQLEAYSQNYTNAYLSEKNKILALDHIIKQYDFINVLSLDEDIYNKKILSQESEKLIHEALINDKKIASQEPEKLINEPLKYDTICFWENEEEKINFIANCLFEIEKHIEDAVCYLVEKQEDEEESPYYIGLKIKNKTIGKITNPIKTYLEDKNFDYIEYKNELNLFYRELNEASIIDKYNKEQKGKIYIIIKELKEEIVAKKEDPKKEKYNNRIFKSFEAFVLFEKYIKNIEKNEIAETSFLFRQMIKDNMIYESVKHSEYFELLSKYDISPSKIKAMYQVENPLRINLFKSLKDIYYKK